MHIFTEVLYRGMSTWEHLFVHCVKMWYWNVLMNQACFNSAPRNNTIFQCGAFQNFARHSLPFLLAILHLIYQFFKKMWVLYVILPYMNCDLCFWFGRKLWPHGNIHISGVGGKWRSGSYGSFGLLFVRSRRRCSDSKSLLCPNICQLQWEI